MKQLRDFCKIPWNHDFWSLLRYYRSLRIRRDDRKAEWLADLKENASLPGQQTSFPIDPELVGMLESYIPASANLLSVAIDTLRTEKEALDYCEEKSFPVGKTTVRNRTHHQSSKALIAAVSGIAAQACADAGVEVDLDPQRRAVWLSEKGLHVSARNLDGAVPSLQDPSAIWEIKEYWGTTKGGSKMSDAVYECHLVGLELRMSEAKTGLAITHIVFVDGKDQWGYRRSDLSRFIDLHQQGLIDHLIVGREVETEWKSLIKGLTTA